MTAYTADDLSPTLFYSPVAPLREHAGHGERAGVLREIAARERRGHVALCSRDLDAAELHFTQVLELRQRAGAWAHSGLPHVFGLLGVVAARRDDLHRAGILFELGLEVARALRTRLTAEDAMLLQNLGVVARRLGQLDEAEIHHEAALAIKVQELGATHPSVATTLGSLGALLLLRGRFVEALAQFERARELAVRASGAGSTSVAQWQLGSGSAHLQLGHHAQAEFCFAAAVDVYEAIPGAATQLAKSRMHLAQARWHRDPCGARRLAEHALHEYMSGARPELGQVSRMQMWLQGHIERAA